MKHFATAAFSLILLAGCQESEKAGATTETSPGGIEYARLYIPRADDVAIQIAWPTSWALRDDVNQAAPHIGTDLILAGGAEDFPPGEAVETFADLKAEGTMWVTVDLLHGQLIAPKDNLDKAIEIAAAHLAKPTLDQGWFDRIQKGFAANMAEAQSQPANLGYDALRWAILGDTPLRRALSVDPPEMITTATRAEVLDWHQQTVVRTGEGGDCRGNQPSGRREDRRYFVLRASSREHGRRRGTHRRFRAKANSAACPDSPDIDACLHGAASADP
ncbi:MAG: insulinase family protein [Rhodobacteraceae bacterium]|nr:insulinase family protein [Paracoccaceae bacterium]